ncbi:MAG: hypothetical protein V3S64_14160 [bacterium]
MVRPPARIPALARSLVPALILALALLAVNPGPAGAQTQIVDGGRTSSLLGGILFAGEKILFKNDGRIKLLVLNFQAVGSGLSDSGAEGMTRILFSNLTNTGNFDMVGSLDIDEVYKTGNKDQRGLLDCRVLDCGVKIGKRQGADFVVVGSLEVDKKDNDLKTLKVRIINISNNLADFEEELRFKDEEEALFNLANDIKRNFLLRGRVLSTSIRGIVISLGKQHGIKIRDNLVIYKEEVPITDLKGKKVDTQRKNIAIVRVLNVNHNSSEAIIIHKTEDPQVGFFVQTYLDNVRQIKLVETTRRELDTGIRLANRIRPLVLAPVVIRDIGRQEWLTTLEAQEGSRDFWFTVALIAGGATAFFLMDFDTDESTDQLTVGAAGGVFGFAAWRWIQSRKNINDLMVEGRGLGYVGSLIILPYATSKEKGIRLAFRF